MRWGGKCKRRAASTLERLEARRLLSALQAEMISGTSGDDHFYAKLSANHATLQVWNTATPVGAANQSFSVATLAGCTFDTGSGNDSLELDLTNGMIAAVTFAAGINAE